MARLLACVLAVLAVVTSTQGQGQKIYEICTDHVIDPNLQKFSIISPGLGTPGGYPSNVRCHIDYAKTTTPRILRVSFPSFSLEKHDKCQKDSLRVGHSAILCGAWPQGRTMDFVVMPGKTFMFSFNTDATTNLAGFVLDVQVGAYTPGQLVKVYSGRGDYYTQDYTGTVCSCGTLQGSSLAAQFNYQPKCNCKLTHDHVAPARTPIQRMRSSAKNMLSTWAAGKIANGLSKIAQKKMASIPVPKSNPYTVPTMPRPQGGMFSPSILQAMALSSMMKKSGGAGGEAAEGGAMGEMGGLFGMGGAGAESETEGGAGSSGLGGLFKNWFGRQRQMFGGRWAGTTTAKPEEMAAMQDPTGHSEDDDESSSSSNLLSMNTRNNYYGSGRYSAFPRNNQYRPRVNNNNNNNLYPSNQNTGFGGYSVGSGYPRYQQRGSMQTIGGFQRFGQPWSQQQQQSGGEGKGEVATHEAAPGGERD